TRPPGAACGSRGLRGPLVGARRGSTLDPDVAASTAEVPPDHAQTEAGQAGPQPPLAVRLLEPAVERDQPDEGDQPEGGADRDRAYAVHVERVDVGDDVGAVADLVRLHLRLVLHRVNVSLTTR